jgi:hypothetical protein
MNYQAVPAIRSEEPLLLGMIGPPGGGKSLSSLRLAKGIQSVRGGDIIVIDTEGGRSRKYNDLIPFNIVELPPTARSNDFIDCIQAQLPSKPAAIIVDSMSDEHLSYLEWHDEMVPKSGGNEWAAWAKPAAARKKLIAGILKIKVPLIFTFRARDKTKQEGRKVINIGWQPVAPLEIVHTLDLTCILPPRADGVPVWKSDKIGEDFIIKLPNYLAPFIETGKPLCEEMGAAFANWAKGSPPIQATKPAALEADPAGGAAGTNDDLTAAEWDVLLGEAAIKGSASLAECWSKIPREHKPTLEAAKNRRHKPTAAEADARAPT